MKYVGDKKNGVRTPTPTQRYFLDPGRRCAIMVWLFLVLYFHMTTLLVFSRRGSFYYPFLTPDRRQSKTLKLSMNSNIKIVKNTVFDCHLTPDWRQMAIENTISSYLIDLRSSISK